MRNGPRRWIPRGADSYAMRRSFLGRRTLFALAGVACLGLVLWLLGAETHDVPLSGVGVMFALLGGGGAVGILIRWLIYREIS
jgi:hypothetical protein